MWGYPGHFETHQWPVLSGHFLTPWSMSLLLFFCSPDSRTLSTTHSLGANPSFHFSDNHLFSLLFLHVPLNASSYTPLKGLFPYVLNPSFCGFYFQPIMFSPRNLIHYLQTPNTLPLSPLPLCILLFPICHLLITSSLQPRSVSTVTWYSWPFFLVGSL